MENLGYEVKEIVEKIGTDQYKLKNELDRLSVMGNITSEVVKKFIPRQLKDMAYNLLELAIKGDETNLRIAIKDTQIISDPYKTFGLLVSQFFNISAIVLEPNHPTNIIAEKLGVNLFVLNKLKSSARSLSIGDLRRIILEFTDADTVFLDSSLTPACLAILDNEALRRAAVFFFSRFFLTALSSSLCAFDRFLEFGSARKLFVADLISFLIEILRSRRLLACLTRFIADFMIGMILLSFTSCNSLVYNLSELYRFFS